MTPEQQAGSALEKLGIYLSWVPPNHAHDARRAEQELSEALDRLVAERDEAQERYNLLLKEARRANRDGIRLIEAAEGREAALREALEYIDNGVDNPRAVAHSALAAVPAADPAPPDEGLRATVDELRATVDDLARRARWRRWSET